jgi:hypothetical protein
MENIPDSCREFLQEYATSGFPVCKSPRFLSNQRCPLPQDIFAW